MTVTCIAWLARLSAVRPEHTEPEPEEPFDIRIGRSIAWGMFLAACAWALVALLIWGI